MQVRWIIENYKGRNGYEELVTEVRRQGYDCDILDVTNHFYPKKYEHELLCFQGSIQLFRGLKQESVNCGVIGWNTAEKYLCTSYYHLFGDLLFNDNYCFIPAGELERNLWNFYKNYGKESIIFLRPNDGDKSFSGGLFDLNDFDREWGQLYEFGVDKGDLVVVSSPKNIKGEWRFVCSDDREILGVSSYKLDGQSTYVPSAPREATELVQDILSRDYFPDPVFTIDVAADNDWNFWLMEFNSFTSAGLYGCKLEKIVDIVSNKIKEHGYKK